MVLAVAVTISHAASAEPASYPSCRIEQQAPIAFAAPEAADTLKVSVIGAPCYKGRLTIEITSRTGAKLYSYSADVKKHVVTQWDDPDLPASAEELVERIVAFEPKTTADLPAWLPEDDYYEEHYETIEITQERYEALRKQRVPMFSHPTHYEEWQVVVFDPTVRKAVVILAGGA
jgi:hypothetical protein